MDWNSYFMNGCHWVRTKSKDPNTKVGCIIVGPDHEIRTSGYNGLPRGCNDSPVPYPERHDRTKEKYSWYEHAERNAIYNAARTGIPLLGCTAYITALPCPDCSRGLINSGIKEVYWVHDPSFTSTPERKESFNKTLKLSIGMLREAGLSVVNLTSTVDNVWCVGTYSCHTAAIAEPAVGLNV